MTRPHAGAAHSEKVKEEAVRELSAFLSSHGVVVRREELKRGPGWRVMSGGCRVEGKPVLFVDRRVSLDEQLDVVIEKVKALAVIVPHDILERLPAAIRRHFETVGAGGKE